MPKKNGEEMEIVAVFPAAEVDLPTVMPAALEKWSEETLLEIARLGRRYS